MPRKAKTVVEEDLLPLSESEWTIEDFMQEWAPQSAVVEIYRKKADGTQPHIERVDITILQADLYGYLREKWGNGRYNLQFKNSERRIVKSLLVDVEGSEQKPQGNVNGNGNGGKTFEQELILAMIATNKAPAFDLVGLAAIMKEMKPSSDPAAMLAAMATTFQQLKPAEDNVDKALTIISKAKEIAGGEGREENMYTLIKDVGKTVVEKLSPGVNPPTVTQVPQPRPQLPQNSQPAQPETADQMLERWLRVQLAFLKSKAQQDKDPDFWVDYLFENQEEPGCHAVLEVIQRGATMEHLLAFDPEIAQNPKLKTWFEKLYATLHADLAKNVDTTGKGGDPADVGGNADPGKK